MINVDLQFNEYVVSVSVLYCTLFLVGTYKLQKSKTYCAQLFHCALVYPLFDGCRKSDMLLIRMSKFMHMIISILYVVKLQRIILDNMLFLSSQEQYSLIITMLVYKCVPSITMEVFIRNFGKFMDIRMQNFTCSLV